MHSKINCYATVIGKAKGQVYYMKKKVIALIAMLLVISMLLPACKKDGEGEETTDPDKIEETTDSEEKPKETYIVTDENGGETSYEVLGFSEVDGVKYYALVAWDENDEESTDDYIVYRAEEDEDGNEVLTLVEDQSELEKAKAVIDAEIMGAETETVDQTTVDSETTVSPEEDTTLAPSTDETNPAPDTTVSQAPSGPSFGGGSIDVGGLISGGNLTQPPAQPVETTAAPVVTTLAPSAPTVSIPVDTVVPVELITTNSGRLLIHTISDRTTNRTDDNSTTLAFMPIKDPNAKVDMNAEQNRQKVNLASVRPGAIYNGVLVGYDNYLFYKDTLNDFEGNGVLATSLYNKAVADLKERNEWVEANGMKFYFVIAPNKNTVYHEYMPETYTLASYRRYDQFVELLSEAGITAVDLRETMANAVKANPQENLYYKYDTHWNNHAGYHAYRTAMDLIDEDFPNVVIHDRSEYQINYTETYMKDLCWYTGNYDRVTDYGPVYTLKTGQSARLAWKSDAVKYGQYQFSYIDSQGYSDRLVYFQYINDSNVNAPNIYVMRDSYSIALVPFMKDSFYKSTYNWTWSFSKEDILNSEADVVMVVVAERNLRNYVNNKAVSD